MTRDAAAERRGGAEHRRSPTREPSPSPQSIARGAGRVDGDDGEVAVGIDAASRSRRVERPSAKVTVTSPPRRLWALVRTWPSATTTPDPRPLRPMLTIDGPTAVGDGRDGRADLFDGAHDWAPPVVRDWGEGE